MLRRTFPVLFLAKSLLLFLIGSGQTGYAQTCPYFERDTIFQWSGDPTAFDDWEINQSSDGAQWQVDAGDLMGLLPPQDGNWIYVSEADSNQLSKAVLVSPAWNLRGLRTLELSFFLNLQTFQGAGLACVEVLANNEWHCIFLLEEDYYGQVSVKMDEFAGQEVKLRFTFDDEGEWSWGMGLDDIALSGRPGSCGDGICEEGDCPEDCAVPETPPAWIPVHQDLYGQMVQYQRFARGDRCDDCSEPVELGFALSLYGKEYQAAFLNTNGNLTFEGPHYEYTPLPFCLEGPTMIAPFFADVDLNYGGDIWYYGDPEGHYFIITWMEVGYFGCPQPDCDQKNTFQAILTDGSVRTVGDYVLPQGANVLFSYQDMQWTTGTSSEGVRGFGGAAATVGVNQGDGQHCQDYGTFDRAGLAYFGNSRRDGCPPNEVGHLRGRTLAFNSTNGEQLTPREGLSLDGEWRAETVQLTWTTEVPNRWDYFLIESGSDSTNLQQVAMVPAIFPDHLPAGTFAYELPSVQQGATWYAVTGIDVQGQLQASNPILLAPGLNTPAVQLLSVGPNPIQGPLQVRLQAFETVRSSWQVTDMKGVPLLQGAWDLQPGLAEQVLRLPDLPAGTYMFTVRAGDSVQYRYLVQP